jgi:hypothetical protein
LNFVLVTTKDRGFFENFDPRPRYRGRGSKIFFRGFLDEGLTSISINRGLPRSRWGKISASVVIVKKLPRVNETTRECNIRYRDFT